MSPYPAAGAAGVRDLLRRAVDLGHLGSTRWLAPVLFLMPAVTAITYLTLWSSGRPVREPCVALGLTLRQGQPERSH